jgi:hypothetical protein
MSIWVRWRETSLDQNAFAGEAEDLDEVTFGALINF